MNRPKCMDARKCFGRDERGKCKILATAYRDQECPFAKERCYETKGKIYPFNENYGKLIIE